MLDLEGALFLQARQEVRYLLLEERQHSRHSHPCGPGMDPWMGVEQEAVVQGHKCHAGWHRSSSGVNYQDLPFSGPGSRTIPGCTVVSLHQGIASPFLCFSRVQGPELFQQWETDDLGQSCQSLRFSSPHLLHFVCWEAPLCFLSTFFCIFAKPSATTLQHRLF